MRGLILVCLVAVLSCAASAGAATTPQQRLDAAQARWAKYGARSYAYVVQPTCNSCALPPAGAIRVIGGKPQRPPANLRAYDTVPKLFGMIRRALRRSKIRVDVRYASVTGIPVDVSFTDQRFQVDNVSGFVVRRFRRL